ncbi:MAG: hypothetical protein J7L55_00990 [Desulfurococcales archaeon]|nr:hypothetical protein [Desulfurococcales archaeon]
MKAWVLDVRAGRYGAVATFIDEEGSVTLRELPLSYTAYIQPRGVDVEWLAGKVWEHPEVKDVRVEEWRAPPWYDRHVQVIKVMTDSLQCVYDVVRRVEGLGWGVKVNDYPNPLVRALWEVGLNPCGEVDPAAGKPVGSDGDPLLEEPPYRVVEVRFDPLREFFLVVSNRVKTIVTREGLKALNHVFRGAHILLLGERVRLSDLPHEAMHMPVVTKANYLVGIHGLVEWCRVSWIPIRLLGNASIGKVLTTVEAFEALKRGYLIPAKVGRAETFRPAEELIIADRGGVVITPPRGIHFNVAQLDFNSLYPTIMWRFNVSPETVGRPGCSRSFKVPELGREVCMDFEGVVPAALKSLIKRREVLRRASRDPHLPAEFRGVLDERQKALKWILVASFGYLGYRNSRFGKIEAYECVTALARHVLKEAVRLAESSGFKVLHAIVDSIFVSKGGGSEEDYAVLATELSREVGIGVKVEGIYDWVAFPPTSEGVPSPMKYFGRLRDGSLVVKGLRCVKSSEPLIVREAQLEALKALVAGRDAEGLREALVNAAQVMRTYIRRVLDGNVTQEELAIRKRLRRGSYRYMQPHVRAAMAAHLKSGVVEYVIASVPYPVGRGRGYSPSYYVKSLLKAWREIAEPVAEGLRLRELLNIERYFKELLGSAEPDLT